MTRYTYLLVPYLIPLNEGQCVVAHALVSLSLFIHADPEEARSSLPPPFARAQDVVEAVSDAVEQVRHA